MDDVGNPAKLLHRLEHATCEENGALTIVGIVMSQLVGGHAPLGEVVLVVDEIHGNTCRLYRCHLNNKGVVGIVDDQVHTRQTLHLM